MNNNFNRIRVVWNLTNKCPFNCPMCVTSANIRIEKDIDKNLILQSIISLGKENINIDFSGGDPLFKDKDIEIVKKASEILGRDNISISSTGLSLSTFSDEELLSPELLDDSVSSFLAVKFNPPNIAVESPLLPERSLKKFPIVMSEIYPVNLLVIENVS